VVLCGLPVVLQVVQTTGRPPFSTEVIPPSHISNAEPATFVNIPCAWGSLAPRRLRGHNVHQ
jgi:hypothetical protein